MRSHARDITAKDTRGFSFVQMIVALVIIMALFAMALPRLFSSTAQANYTITDAEDVLNLIRTAQIYAATNRTDSHWGVRIVDDGTDDCNSATSQDCIVIFRGTDYANRDQSYDQILRLRAGNSWTEIQDTDFFFQKFSGFMHGAYGLPHGLVGYWPFTASSTNNIAGTGTPGTINGQAAYLLNGCANDSGCYEFSGASSGYIDAGDSPAFNMGAGSFSLSLWFRQTEIVNCDAAHLAGKRLSGATGSWYRVALDDSIECSTKPTAFFEIAENYPSTYVTLHHPTVLDNYNWHHVVAVRDITASEALKIWVDGNTTSAVGSDTTNVNNTAFFGIAKHSAASDAFKGAIDEVMLFNRALTSQEISQLYDSGNPTSAGAGIRIKQTIKITNGRDTSVITFNTAGAGYVTRQAS